jgi:hypothetical protein
MRLGLTPLTPHGILGGSHSGTYPPRWGLVPTTFFLPVNFPTHPRPKTPQSVGLWVGVFFPEIKMRKLDVKFDEALLGASEVWGQDPTDPTSWKVHIVATYDGEKLYAHYEAQGFDEEAILNKIDDLFAANPVLGLDAPVVLWRPLA